MGQNCAHQQKNLDQRTRIPAVFRGTILIRTADGLCFEADVNFVDETASAAEQRLPEVLERRRPIEKLRLCVARRNYDALFVVLAVQAL